MSTPLPRDTSHTADLFLCSLLVLGLSFIAGGFNRPEQQFNITMANTSSALLLFAALTQVIIGQFHDRSTSTFVDTNTSQISRGTAIIMVLVYVAFIYFQLVTHKDQYNETSRKTAVRGLPTAAPGLEEDPTAHTIVDVEQGTPSDSCSAPQPKVDEAELSFWAATILLILSTAIIAWSAECLVSSLDYFVTQAGISRVFVGLILLPLVGNAAEHATAVTCAIKDKMDITIAVAVGSSVQIAMFLIPCLVILGWCLGIDEMTLAFDFGQLVALLSAVLLANHMLGVRPACSSAAVKFLVLTRSRTVSRIIWRALSWSASTVFLD